MGDDVPEEVPNLDLHPCTICGRTFLPESLKKHAKVCERAQIKKRKVFDSLKQRVEGTDLEQFHQKRYLKRPENINVIEPKPKPNKWKEKHLELVNTIRAAKGVGDTNDTMSPATKISTPTIGAGNERCPSCDRQFGPKAFDRHVEWCKERKTRIQKSPASVLQAKERLEARIKYRVPPLNKSKRSLTREKYSPTNKTESVTNLRSSSTLFEKNHKSVSSCNLVSPTERKQKSTPGGVIRNKQEHTELPKVPKEDKKTTPVLTSFKNFQTKRNMPQKKINTTSVNDTETTCMTVSNLKIHYSNDDKMSVKMVTWGDTVANKITNKNTQNLLQNNHRNNLTLVKPVKKLDVILEKENECKYSKVDVNRQDFQKKNLTSKVPVKDTRNSITKKKQELHEENYFDEDIIEQSSGFEKKTPKQPKRVSFKNAPPLIKTLPIKNKTPQPLPFKETTKMQPSKQSERLKKEAEGLKKDFMRLAKDLNGDKSDSASSKQSNKSTPKEPPKSPSLKEAQLNVLDENLFENPPKKEKHWEDNINISVDIKKKPTINEENAPNKDKDVSFDVISKDFLNEDVASNASLKNEEPDEDPFLCNYKPRALHNYEKLSLKNILDKYKDNGEETVSFEDKNFMQPLNTLKHLNDGYKENDKVKFKNILEKFKNKGEIERADSSYCDNSDDKVVREQIDKNSENCDELIDTNVNSDIFKSLHSVTVEENACPKTTPENNHNGSSSGVHNETVSLSNKEDKSPRLIKEIHPETQQKKEINETKLHLQQNSDGANLKKQNYLEAYLKYSTQERVSSVQKEIESDGDGDKNDQTLNTEFLDKHITLDSDKSAKNTTKIDLKNTTIEELYSEDILMSELSVKNKTTSKSPTKSGDLINHCVGDGLICTQRTVNDGGLPTNFKHVEKFKDTVCGDKNDLATNNSDSDTNNSDTNVINTNFCPNSDSTIIPPKSIINVDNNESKLCENSDDAVEVICKGGDVQSISTKTRLSSEEIEVIENTKFYNKLCFSSDTKIVIESDRSESISACSDQSGTITDSNDVTEDNKKSLVSILDEQNSDLTDFDSIEGNDMDKWTEALSNARLDHNMRKCHSDICVPPTLCAIQEDLTSDQILELGGKEFLMAIKEDTYKIETKKSVTSISSISSIDGIPTKRRKINKERSPPKKTTKKGAKAYNFAKTDLEFDINKIKHYKKEGLDSTDVLEKLSGDSEKQTKDDPKNQETKLKLPEIKLKNKQCLRKEIKTAESIKLPEINSNERVKYEYNPFISAEKQLMELLECDDYKPTTKPTKTTQKQRPKTSVTKPKLSTDKNKKIKSAEKSRQNKPPPIVIDDDDLLNDNFELIENFINGTFANDNRKPNNGFFLKETDNNLNLKTILNERKYSDDMSSIDPSLINENDNLSIPESFKKDYSPTSTVDNYSSDTTIQNEPDVDIYSVQYDKKINTLESFVLPKTETVSELKRSVSCVDENVQLDKLIKTLHDESFPKKKSVRNLRKTKSQDHSKPTVSLNSSLGRNVKSNEMEKSSKLKHSDGGDGSDRNQRSYERSRSVSPEKELRKDPENISADELFSIDDDLYEEYKKYEQMYLQEKEEMKKKSAVIGTSDEEDRVMTNPKKISGDSAYGSLNRKTPKLRSRLTKLSPLEHHSQEHQESASSSGSEMSPVMKVSSSNQNQRMSKFCHECGNKYPLSTAKFCVECGVRRLVL